MKSQQRAKDKKGWSLRPLGPLLGMIVFASHVIQADTSFDWEKAKQMLGELRNSPDSVSRWVEESKILFYMGRATANTEEKTKYLSEGEILAAKAKEAEATNPGALFWWSANHGLLMSMHKSLSCLVEVKIIEKTLLELKALDPKFENGGADRALANIYAAAPPVISLGSPRKAQQSYLAALRLAPHYPGNTALYANFLMGRGECQEAQKYAHDTLSSPELALHPLESPEWIRLAKRVVEKSAQRSCP